MDSATWNVSAPLSDLKVPDGNFCDSSADTSSSCQAQVLLSMNSLGRVFLS